MPDTDTTVPPALEAALSDWLEHERERFSAAAHAVGLPPAVMVNVSVGTHDGKGGVQGGNEVRSASITATYTPSALLHAVAPLFDSGARTLANDIHNTFGESVVAFSPMTIPKYGDDPVGWIEAHLLGYIRDEYLSRLESLDIPNLAVAAEVVTELIEFVTSPEVDLVTVLPIHGVQPDQEPCSYGPVTLRSLTPEELGLSMGALYRGFSPRRKMIQRWDFPVVIHTCAIEVRESGAKTSQVMGKLLIHRIVLALQLLGFEPSGVGQATTYTHPGPTVGLGGHGVRLPPHGEMKTCTAAELERAVKLAAQIGDDVYSNPATQQSVSLHRFHLGTAGDSPADAVIDYCIALEGLLLQGNAELSFRFRLFGAHYLRPNDPAGRREVFKQLGEIYGARSTLVHGGTPSSLGNLQDLARRARGLAAEGLLRALAEGWPSPSSLSDAPLG